MFHLGLQGVQLLPEPLHGGGGALGGATPRAHLGDLLHHLVDRVLQDPQGHRPCSGESVLGHDFLASPSLPPGGASGC